MIGSCFVVKGAEVVRDLTEEGIGVDAALECVGLEASFNACVDAVRRAARWCRSATRQRSRPFRSAVKVEGSRAEVKLAMTALRGDAASRFRSTAIFTSSRSK